VSDGRNALEMLGETPVMVVVANPQGYCTSLTTGIGIIEAWKDVMYSPPWDAPDDEVQAFRIFAEDPDNWYFGDGILSMLDYPLGGEEPGSIKFYRLTHMEHGEVRFVEQLGAAHREIERLKSVLNTPEFQDFTKAVPLEAAHAMNRWDDSKKEPQDWFWLVGYLAGKALHAHLSGDFQKALHHTISSAGALANWHRQVLIQRTAARVGISAQSLHDGIRTVAQQLKKEGGA